MNLFSAIAGSLCVLFIAKVIFCLLPSKNTLIKYIASIGGGITFLFCRAFLKFAETAEVYTLQNFILVVLLFVLIKSLSSNSNLHFNYSFAFLYGISLGIHISMLLFVPEFLIFFLSTSPGIFKPKYFSFMIFFFVVGTLVYIYLPFRSMSLLAFDWGDPETVYQFLAQVFDQKDLGSKQYHFINLSFLKFRLYIGHLIDEFSILLCLIGVIGLLGLAISYFSVAILSCLIFASNVAFFLNAGWVVSWGYIPSFLIFSIFIGYGIYFIYQGIQNLSKKFASLYVVFILKFLLGIGIMISIFNMIDISRYKSIKNDYSAKLIGKKILSDLPLDAIIFSEYMWFPLLYMQHIERRRPDLTVMLQGEILLPEYFETISKKRFPNINHLHQDHRNNMHAYDYFWELSAMNMAEHQIFVEPDGQLQSLIQDHLIPQGILFLFRPDKAGAISENDVNDYNDYLHRLAKEVAKNISNIEGQKYLANKIDYMAKFWSKLNYQEQAVISYDVAVSISPEYYKINHNYGSYLLSKGKVSHASKYLTKSYDIHRYDPKVYKSLAKPMMQIGKYRTGLFLVNRSIELNKYVDIDSYELMGRIYTELEDCASAIMSFDMKSRVKNKFSTNGLYKAHNQAEWNSSKLYEEFCYEHMIRHITQ